MGKFVYLAVEICHRWTLLSATPSFQVKKKNFENRQKHQRRRTAWVGQADFGKLELRDGPLENLLGGAGEVQKKYSRKAKLNEKKFMHAN